MFTGHQSPYPVRDFINGANDGFAEQRAKREKPWAAATECPCEICQGDGHLVLNASIAPVLNPGRTFKTAGGAEIKINQLIICPVCLGTGIDSEHLIRVLKQSEEAAA